MKRFISIIAVLFSLASVFAQNAKYKELLGKAKSYESKNEWAYALGFYADAITADPLNAKEAVEKFNSITDSIYSGNPGLTPVTGRRQMEAWENLLCNTEKYFTEYFPYFVKFSKLEMKKKNGKNYDYWSNVYYSFNIKFNKIVVPILKGYKKVYQESWGLPDVPFIEENFDECMVDDRGKTILTADSHMGYNPTWPAASVTKIKNPERVALNVEKDRYDLTDKNDSSYYYNKVATYSGTGFLRYFYNSFAVNTISFVHDKQKTLYELTLVIADKKGKALCSPVKYMLGSEPVTFENIPANVADMIDDETARIKVTGIALKHGYVNDDEPVESLPSVPVNASNAEIHDSLDTKNLVTLFRSYDPERRDYKKRYLFSTVEHEDSFSVAYFKNREEEGIREIYEGILTSFENDILIKVDSSYKVCEMSNKYLANRFSAYEGVSPCYDEFCSPIDGNGYKESEDGSIRFEKKLSPAELEEYKNQLKLLYEPEMKKYERLVALKNNYQLGREDSTTVGELIESFSRLKSAVEENDADRISDLVSQLQNILPEEKLSKFEARYAERERDAAGARDVYERSNVILQKVGDFFANDYENSSRINSCRSSLKSFASAIKKNSINDMANYKKSFEKADLPALEKIYDEYVIKADPVIRMYNEKNIKFAELKELYDKSEYRSALDEKGFSQIDKLMKSAGAYIESSRLRELVKMESQIAAIDFTEPEKSVTKIKEEKEKKEIRSAVTARKRQMLDKISEYHDKKFNMYADNVNEYSIVSLAIEESRKSVEELAAMATADASLEVLREAKNKIEAITTENLDLLLADIKKGKELISKMGIKLTLDVSNNGGAIYSLDIEKKSIAEKAKVKGKSLIFVEGFNPATVSRKTSWGCITDCSLEDFCIRIARSSGKDFDLYTSAKDKPFVIRVP